MRTYEQAREGANSAVSKARTAYDRGREAFDRTRRDVENTVSDAADQASDVLSSGALPACVITAGRLAPAASVVSMTLATP